MNLKLERLIYAIVSAAQFAASCVDAGLNTSVYNNRQLAHTSCAGKCNSQGAAASKRPEEINKNKET